jgi:RNA-directed DNA polymerase
MSSKTQMNGGGESYSGVVLAKHPNKTGKPEAEGVEGRPLTKENAEQPNPCRTQNRESGSNGMARVREAAKRDGKLQFTALLHHVTIDLLGTVIFGLRRKLRPGWIG